MLLIALVVALVLGALHVGAIVFVLIRRKRRSAHQSDSENDASNSSEAYGVLPQPAYDALSDAQMRSDYDVLSDDQMKS